MSYATGARWQVTLQPSPARRDAAGPAISPWRSFPAQRRGTSRAHSLSPRTHSVTTLLTHGGRAMPFATAEDGIRLHHEETGSGTPAAPQRRVRAESDDTLALAIPARHDDALPWCASVGQHRRKRWQAPSCGPGAPDRSRSARWRRAVDSGVEPQAGDADHATASQRRQAFEGGLQVRLRRPEDRLHLYRRPAPARVRAANGGPAR